MLLLTLQNETLSYRRSTTTPKRDNISPKNRSLLVHIAELSTPVAEVAIKVISASLTQNQCFQCVTPPLTHVGIPRPRDATELNNDGMIKSGDVHHQSTTEFINFSERDLINDDSSFYSHIRLATDLLFHVFTFEKLFIKCPSLSVKGIFDDVRHDVISP